MQQNRVLTQDPIVTTAATSRGVHIVLGILFGGLGLHNFYAAHYLRGAGKLGLLMLCLILDSATGFTTGFMLIAAVICGFWTIIELIVVNVDGNGRRMT